MCRQVILNPQSKGPSNLQMLMWFASRGTHSSWSRCIKALILSTTVALVPGHICVS